MLTHKNHFPARHPFKKLYGKDVKFIWSDGYDDTHINGQIVSETYKSETRSYKVYKALTGEGLYVMIGGSPFYIDVGGGQ